MRRLYKMTFYLEISDASNAAVFIKIGSKQAVKHTGFDLFATGVIVFIFKKKKFIQIMTFDCLSTFIRHHNATEHTGRCKYAAHFMVLSQNIPRNYPK